MRSTAQLSARRRELCQNVRTLRRRMGVSQQQFARLVGVDPRTIWNWEAHVYAPTTAKRFRLGQLMRLVDGRGSMGGGMRICGGFTPSVTDAGALCLGSVVGRMPDRHDLDIEADLVAVRS